MTPTTAHSSDFKMSLTTLMAWDRIGWSLFCASRVPLFILQCLLLPPGVVGQSVQVQVCVSPCAAVLGASHELLWSSPHPQRWAEFPETFPQISLYRACSPMFGYERKTGHAWGGLRIGLYLVYSRVPYHIIVNNRLGSGLWRIRVGSFWGSALRVKEAVLPSVVCFETRGPDFVLCPPKPVTGLELFPGEGAWSWAKQLSSAGAVSREEAVRASGSPRFPRLGEQVPRSRSGDLGRAPQAPLGMSIGFWCNTRNG